MHIKSSQSVTNIVITLVSKGVHQDLSVVYMIRYSNFRLVIKLYKYQLAEKN